MEKIADVVSRSVDPAEFYSEWFGKVNGRANLPCPFPARHKGGADSLPSFRVFLDTGGTYCHGCGYKSSSPVGFFADLKGMTFERAARVLYARYVEKTVPADAYGSPAEKLLANPFVLAKLLKSRGITLDTARRFRLGYDGKRLTIPIFNEHGLCVNLRKYDLFKSGSAKMLSYAEGFGKARLFPLESLRGPTVYVVEGELDAIIGCQAGLPCVSPTGGATNWEKGWGRLFDGKTVFVIPDNDEPGRRGAAQRAASIGRHAKSCTILRLPVEKPGEDLTDWMLSYGGTPEKLRELSRKTGADPGAARPARSPDMLDGLEEGGKSKSEAALVARSEAVWAELTKDGAFFKNSAAQLFYAGDGIEAMPVSSSVGPFMSFLTNKTPLANQALSSGKFMLNHIVYKAYRESELSKTGTWTMYDGGKLYIHAGRDKILRLGEGKPAYIKNAVNEDRVLLDLPVRSMVVDKLPTTSPADGLSALKRLFMHNLAMQDEDRYMVVCWLFSIFFRDYVRPKPIVRFLAKTASGKSTSSKLISILLYGEELLSHSASTVAATYEMSSKYPLLMLDNLESRNMTPQLEDFLLVAATGGMKAKRMLSTDSGLVLQHTNSLVLTNGIEPFSRHELIDRTMEVDLDLERYANEGFQESKIFSSLKEARAGILSAVLFLMYRYVIPRIRRGEIPRIMREFGQHGKERFNEYLAVMCIVLDAFWGYMPLTAYRRPHDLVNFWLDSQTRAEQKQDEGTNEVLYFLSTFVDRYEQLIGAQVKVAKAEAGASMRCTTRELLSEFRMLAKSLGMRCPWGNERQLGTRVVDAMDVLNRAGWYRRQYMSAGRVHYEYKFLAHKAKKEKEK